MTIHMTLINIALKPSYMADYHATGQIIMNKPLLLPFISLTTEYGYKKEVRLNPIRVS